MALINPKLKYPPRYGEGWLDPTSVFEQYHQTPQEPRASQIGDIPTSVVRYLEDVGWTFSQGRCFPPGKYHDDLRKAARDGMSWNTAVSYETFQRMTVGSYNHE